MARAMQAERSAIERGESIALETTSDTTAAGIGGGIATTKMGTGPTSAGGDQGRDPGIVITSANTHTDIGHDHAQENTEDIDREVTSAVVRTIVTDRRKTASMAARGVRDETRGVAIAVKAAAGHHTSTQDHTGKALIDLEHPSQITAESTSYDRTAAPPASPVPVPTGRLRWDNPGSAGWS